MCSLARMYYFCINFFFKSPASEVDDLPEIQLCTLDCGLLEYSLSVGNLILKCNQLSGQSILQQDFKKKINSHKSMNMHPLLWPKLEISTPYPICCFADCKMRQQRFINRVIVVFVWLSF